jgi:hypothetical protein
VREAAIARTGKAPGGLSSAELPGSARYDPLWQFIKIVLIAAAIGAVGVWLAGLGRGTGTPKTWEEIRGGWIMLLVSGAVLLFFIAMSVRDARARRNRADHRESSLGEPPLSPSPGSGRRPRSWLFKLSFLSLVAGGLVTALLLLWRLGELHFPSIGESGSSNHAAAESAGEFVLYTMPARPVPGQADTTNLLYWTFKCLVPANHLAHVVFVRWTDAGPRVEPGLSAYLKVGKTSMDEDFYLCCARLAEAPSSGKTNGVQWEVRLVARFGGARSHFPDEPEYRRLETSARMTVRSGHQGVLRLVDYVRPEGESSHSQSGVELRIFLEPFKSPPVRTDPFEVEGTNYVAGRGLGWTMEEALKAIKKWPADP